MANGFSLAQIALHWLVAGLILYNLPTGDAMSQLWRQIGQGTATPTTHAARVHTTVGSVVLAFALWRLVLRFTRVCPQRPTGKAAGRRSTTSSS